MKNNKELQQEYIILNSNPDLPKENKSGSLIIIGCDYYTSWQRDYSMKLKLINLKNSYAELENPTSNKTFWTHVDGLRLITNDYNINNGKILRPNLFEHENT